MVEMVQKAIRFRASAEVHAAAASLTSAGIDINKLVSECILNEAKPKPEIYTYAKAVGLEVREPYELWDQDAVVVKVVTNGNGKRWNAFTPTEPRRRTDEPRVILLFTFYESLPRGRFSKLTSNAVYASGTVIQNGDEIINREGVTVPAGLSGTDLIAFAEAHVRSHDPYYAVQRSA